MSTQAAEILEQKDSRRVPKPLMEKRRRERINQSLETLRMLLLENTHNERLKNPKVEKAEILESVVHFLRAEQALGTDPFQITRGKRPRTEEYDGDVGSPCKRQNYHDGMRTCLIRVGNFIANKNQEFGQELEKVCGNLHKSHSMLSTPTHTEPQVYFCEDPSQRLTHVQLSNSCTPSGCSKLAQSTVLNVPNMTKQPVMLCDPVWRPW